MRKILVTLALGTAAMLAPATAANAQSIGSLGGAPAGPEQPPAESLQATVREHPEGEGLLVDLSWPVPRSPANAIYVNEAERTYGSPEFTCTPPILAGDWNQVELAPDSLGATVVVNFEQPTELCLWLERDGTFAAPESVSIPAVERTIMPTAVPRLGWWPGSNVIDGWTPTYYPANWSTIAENYCTQSSFEPECTNGAPEFAVSTDLSFPPESTTLSGNLWVQQLPGQVGCNYARMRMYDRWGNPGPWSATETYWIEPRWGEPTTPCASV